jgi:hypothetical protein
VVGWVGGHDSEYACTHVCTIYMCAHVHGQWARHANARLSASSHAHSFTPIHTISHTPPSPKPTLVHTHTPQTPPPPHTHTYAVGASRRARLCASQARCLVLRHRLPPQHPVSSINHPANQSAVHSVIQSPSQSSRLCTQSFNHPANQSAVHSVIHGASLSLTHSITQPISRLCTQSFNHPANQSAVHSVNQSPSQSVGCALSHSITQPISRLCTQSFNHPANPVGCSLGASLSLTHSFGQSLTQPIRVYVVSPPHHPSS